MNYHPALPLSFRTEPRRCFANRRKRPARSRHKIICTGLVLAATLGPVLLAGVVKWLCK